MWVVESILCGETTAYRAMIDNGIPGNMTVHRWIKQYKQNPNCWVVVDYMEEPPPNFDLDTGPGGEARDEAPMLRKALSEALDKVILLEKIIEITQRDLKIKIIKKPEAKRPRN